jgi:hypothetical protein
MATRMQQRRGTAAQWTAANPVLAAGEIGFETDTNKFKMGNGSSAWTALQYFANAAELSAIIDGAPDLLNTLNELAAAIGDDPQFFATVGQNLTTHINDSTMIHGIADTSALALQSHVNTAATDAANALSTHNSDTTLVHGIQDTADLALKSEVQGARDDASGALSTHTADTTLVHGIADTSLLVVQADLSAHNSETENVHGIADTSALALLTDVSDHNAETANVHGIPDTSVLVTQSDLSNAVSEATVDQEALAGTGIDWNSVDQRFDISSTIATKQYSDDAVSTHNDDTSNVHGIADTSLLATKSYADTAEADAITAAGTAADSKIATAVAALTKSSVGLGNVDNTSDANKPVSTAAQTALNAKLNLSGGTLTGALTLSGAPTSDLHAATKQYVDGLAAGINFHQPVVAATSGNLAGTYNNGTNGVGATITAASNGSIGTIDGASVSVGNRILLRAQTDAKQNGVYTVTAVGSAGAPWVVTRAADADNNPAGELATGDFVFVTSGSTNGSKGYILSTTGTITVGTTEISYSQFNASEAVIAGTNIVKTGETISVANAPTFSGLVTAAAAGVAFSDGTQTMEGVPSRTPIIQKTASYTLSALTERDDLIEMGSSSAMTLTIPTDATLNFPIGTSLDILQTSTGQVTIAGAAGVTVNATPGLKLRTTWSSATLFKRAANTWVVYGDLTA